jgi:ABC-type glycerol-3-phosphate transport system permease component
VFWWNAFNYPPLLAVRETTAGAIPFISHELARWGQMAAPTIVFGLQQLVPSLMMPKYIVRSLVMGAVK